MKRHEWTPWKRSLHYKVALCVCEDFLGAGYKFARNRFGFVRRFWTRKAAQAYADVLNEKEGRGND